MLKQKGRWQSCGFVREQAQHSAQSKGTDLSELSTDLKIILKTGECNSKA